MKIQKAGCILIDKETKKIGLVYREKQNDYSFPKGHKEENETLIECAIREVEEETKRKVILYSDNYIAKEHYYDSNNDEVDMYYYIAIDNGKSDNKSSDTHDLIWISFEDVEDKLSYDSLKEIWNNIKPLVLKVVEEESFI